MENTKTPKQKPISEILWTSVSIGLIIYFFVHYYPLLNKPSKTGVLKDVREAVNSLHGGDANFLVKFQDAINKLRGEDVSACPESFQIAFKEYLRALEAYKAGLESVAPGAKNPMNPAGFERTNLGRARDSLIREAGVNPDRDEWQINSYPY